MLDLKAQLGEYLDHVVQRVEVEDVLEERFGPEPVRPIRPRVPSRWTPDWVYAVAAAVVVLLLVGGVALVFGVVGSDTPVADTVPTTLTESTPTTVAESPPTTTITTTTTPPTTPTASSTVIRLNPAPDVDPVRVSTVLGDLEFTTLQFPPDFEFHAIAETPYGPVAVEDPGLWWSSDYLTWHSVPDPARFDFPGLIVVGDDVVVNGGFTAVRFAWDGTGWIEQGRQEFPYRVDEIVFGPRGAVALAWGEETETGLLFNGTIFSSSDGVHFTEAERPPSKDVFVAAENVPDDDRDLGGCRRTAFATVGKIDTVLATDAGFVALTSASHRSGLICAPLLWFSADGNTWDLVSQDSPFGEISSIDSIAERDGRFVATGEIGEPWAEGGVDPQHVAWVSDDGLTWQLVGSPPAPGAVIVGEVGWMSIAATGEGDAWHPVMWFSTDGLTWDGPYEGPEGLFGQPYFGAQVVVGQDAIFAIGVGPDYVRIPIVGRLLD